MQKINLPIIAHVLQCLKLGM